MFRNLLHPLLLLISANASVHVTFSDHPVFGFGYNVPYEDWYPTVTEITPGSPAQLANFKVCDLLMAINRDSLKGLNLEAVVTLLSTTRTKGTRFKLNHADGNTQAFSGEVENSNRKNRLYVLFLMGILML